MNMSITKLQQAIYVIRIEGQMLLKKYLKHKMTDQSEEDGRTDNGLI